jgi:hypothetical protein
MDRGERKEIWNSHKKKQSSVAGVAAGTRMAKQQGKLNNAPIIE